MKAPWDTIVWWEIRRIPYNLMLLVLGICTIAIVETIGGHYANPGEDVEEPLGIIFGAIVYGVVANVCYTLGWITEILWLGTGPDDTKKIRRTRIFWAGVVLSACLTLLPAILLPVLWAIFGFQHGPQ